MDKVKTILNAIDKFLLINPRATIYTLIGLIALIVIL